MKSMPPELSTRLWLSAKWSTAGEATKERVDAEVRTAKKSAAKRKMRTKKALRKAHTSTHPIRAAALVEVRFSHREAGGDEFSTVQFVKGIEYPVIRSILSLQREPVGGDVCA